MAVVEGIYVWDRCVLGVEMAEVSRACGGAGGGGGGDAGDGGGALETAAVALETSRAR